MSFLTTHNVRAATGDSLIEYDAVDDRAVLDSTFYLPGVIGAGDFKAVQHAGGANLSVDIAAGAAAVPCSGLTNGGNYLVTSTGTYNLGMGSPPASGQYRYDSVVLLQYDRLVDANTNVDSAGYQPVLIVVSGGTAGSAGAATAPTLPPVSTTWAGYLELARVLRTGGESSILNGAITDRRPLAVGTSDRTIARASWTGSVDVSSVTTLLTVTPVLVAGLNYEVVGGVTGTQVTNSGTPTSHLLVNGVEVPGAIRPLSGQAFTVPAGVASGTAIAPYTASSSGPATIVLNIQSSASAFRTTGAYLAVRALTV